MDERIKKIIETLTYGTKTKKIEWERTNRENEFMTRFGNGAITIGHWVGVDDSSGEPSNRTDIAILSKTGESIDRFIFDSGDAQGYRDLMNLHDAARRSHLRIDATLDEILNEIEVKVGKV